MFAEFLFYAGLVAWGLEGIVELMASLTPPRLLVVPVPVLVEHAPVELSPLPDGYKTEEDDESEDELVEAVKPEEEEESSA